jgi:uncharacterized protein (DUF1499 family)
VRFPLIALGVAALALVLLALSGPLYRIGLPLPAAFALMTGGAYLGIAAALLGVCAGLLAYRGGRRLGAGGAVIALALGLTAFGIPYQWQSRAQRVPPIHDISTDLDNPPSFIAVVPMRAEAPNTLERAPDLAALQRKGYPDLQPLTLPLPIDQTFDRALSAAQASGWEIVATDKPTGRIEATDTTRWFGFKDDIVVRLTPWGSGTRVDLRSVSRVGVSDVGTNAERIETFLKRLAAP